MAMRGAHKLAAREGQFAGGRVCESTRRNKNKKKEAVKKRKINSLPGESLGLTSSAPGRWLLPTTRTPTFTSQIWPVALATAMSDKTKPVPCPETATRPVSLGNGKTRHSHRSGHEAGASGTRTTYVPHVFAIVIGPATDPRLPRDVRDPRCPR